MYQAGLLDPTKGETKHYPKLNTTNPQIQPTEITSEI